MELATKTKIYVQQVLPNFWYVIEDTNIDFASDGCTISCWEYNDEEGDSRRLNHIAMSKEEALAIASAINKLFMK
jgi:hypothetical protein